MDKLYDKSEINIMVADILYNSHFYPCVCHPAYYSCIQLMKYKIKRSLNIPYEQQASETSCKYKGNTHKYLISKVKEIIKSKKGISEASIFDRSIKDLKEIRERSDYQDIDISSTIGKKAIDIAKQVRNIINTAV